ncbi:hypothetical protein C8F01DRAFT_750584 [Mycena amicta]|nr:hypothetical protein C8F01DRAFT_750584 [Mycena amicta]
MTIGEREGGIGGRRAGIAEREEDAVNGWLGRRTGRIDIGGRRCLCGCGSERHRSCSGTASWRIIDLSAGRDDSTCESPGGKTQPNDCSTQSWPTSSSGGYVCRRRCCPASSSSVLVGLFGSAREALGSGEGGRRQRVAGSKEGTYRHRCESLPVGMRQRAARVVLWSCFLAHHRTSMRARDNSFCESPDGNPIDCSGLVPTES